jgi:hypothetical protein
LDTNLYVLRSCNNDGCFDSAEETRDEPYAWEAREYLRKKLVGEEVWITSEKPPNATREYGCIYLGNGNLKQLIVLHNLCFYAEI